MQPLSTSVSAHPADALPQPQCGIPLTLHVSQPPPEKGRRERRRGVRGSACMQRRDQTEPLLLTPGVRIGVGPREGGGEQSSALRR